MPDRLSDADLAAPALRSALIEIARFARTPEQCADDTLAHLHMRLAPRTAEVEALRAELTLERERVQVLTHELDCANALVAEVEALRAEKETREQFRAEARSVLAAADRVDPPLSRVIALAESEQALGEDSYFAEEIGDVIAFLENARLHYAEGGS